MSWNIGKIFFNRYGLFQHALKEIESNEKNGLDGISKSYLEYGLNKKQDGSIEGVEWIPAAKNNWDTNSHFFTKEEYGKWTINIKPMENNKPAIKHLSKIKLCIETCDGQFLYRLSPWAKYTVQNTETMLFESLFYDPQVKYHWKYDWPLYNNSDNEGLRIYEAHIGISSEEYTIANYSHFKEKVLPHILYLGYNTIQLMAIVEHAYYASFGYQITSFFAVSSRYGTPDELKSLIDECHKYGIRVLLDIIHGHACKNTEDGLNQFDGTNGCFFHDNGRGYHDLWDSRLFNLSEYEVKRFLLSNLRWFIEEYHFDGFRFDGVTSMLYHHHGNSVGFSGDYKEYYGIHVDVESVTYLQLANYMLKKFYPNIVLIAEEVSGMPALCRPVDEGGFGFDYRLAMAIPDKWIKLLKEQKDEDWNMWDIVYTLTNRRHGEKHVAYAESHDQALVGDKTLAFWLMDANMYWNMSCLQEKNICVDRGIALHKMIRLITMGLGGEAYLTFMGNEFGHPEWLDFPRSGNNDSYHYARRQWHLVHEEHLRYRFLNEFDRSMQLLEKKYKFLQSPQAYVSKHHEEDKTICFERGGLVWIFNFHSTKSYENYRIPVPILKDDDEIFDGHRRVDTKQIHIVEDYGYSGRSNSILIYLPSRVALVFSPV